MKGKEIETGIQEISHEERAKKVIQKIKSIIKDRAEELKEATDKLAEVLEKDIEEITEKDGRTYEW